MRDFVCFAPQNSAVLMKHLSYKLISLPIIRSILSGSRKLVVNSPCALVDPICSNTAAAFCMMEELALLMDGTIQHYDHMSHGPLMHTPVMKLIMHCDSL